MFSQPKDEAEHGRDPDLVSNWLALNQPLLARTLKACQQFHANVYARNCDKVIAAKAVQYRNLRLGQRAGFLQESWHISSFNKNAIAEGWGLRDEDLQIKAIATKAHCTADAEIWKGNCRLCEVQFKRYSDAKATARAFANPKYEGMLKVGPMDQVSGEGSFEASINCEGVSSDPCTRMELDEMAARGSKGEGSQGYLRRFDVSTVSTTLILDLGLCAVKSAFTLTLLLLVQHFSHPRNRRKRLSLWPVCLGSAASVLLRLAQHAAEGAGSGRGSTAVAVAVALGSCGRSIVDARGAFRKHGASLGTLLPSSCELITALLFASSGEFRKTLSSSFCAWIFFSTGSVALFALRCHCVRKHCDLWAEEFFVEHGAVVQGPALHDGQH